MNGIEQEALRFSHACARMNADLQADLAIIRRVEHHQETLVNWLLPPDMSPLETTIAYEQVAIEVTAAVAQKTPNPTSTRQPVGASQCTSGPDVPAKPNMPPARPRNEAGMLRYSRASGTGSPGRSTSRSADHHHHLVVVVVVVVCIIPPCWNEELARRPRASPRTRAACTLPDSKEVQL